MTWRVVVRPEVERDMANAVARYDSQQPGLGPEFAEEVIRTWQALGEKPFLSRRRHPVKDIRWRYPDRFPFRVVYQILEAENVVVIAAVIHAVREERHWKRRV